MKISAQIQKFSDDARASYWFIPSLLVLLSICLSALSLFVDRHTEFSTNLIEWIGGSQNADDARALVSAIAQSIIGVAGVLFSITMLAVSFASGQFGPRLIGNFMRDRGNQWSLGILIATFVFALLILRAIQPSSDDVASFVPHFSLFIAVALALVSVFVMIFHVHHVPETISVSNIVAQLGHQFAHHITSLIDNKAVSSRPDHLPHTDVGLVATGYVHNIIQNRIAEIVKGKGWIVEVKASPGDFVRDGLVVLRIWGPSDLSDEDITFFRETVALGKDKTENQNPVFVAEQLVEIVGRAMSPGINDPFTAIACMQWIEAGLSVAAPRDTGLSIFTAQGVFGPQISFEDLLHRSFGDCLPYVKDDPLTLRSLRHLLDQLSQGASARNKRCIAAFAKGIQSAR